MPKFSVILPIYNVEKYLPACIDSILGQQYKDYEIILVDLYDGTVAQSKFLEFQAMLMGQGESENLEVREICRKMSFDCFVNNPIIGSPGVGEHSSLLDRLGSMGLLGFIPFVMMLITNVFMWTKILPDRGTKIFYLIGIGIIAVFLYFKGLFGGHGYLSLFVILPVTIFGIYLQTQNKTCIKIDHYNFKYYHSTVQIAETNIKCKQ